MITANYASIQDDVICGGSIYIQDSNGLINNCTFYKNSAISYGSIKDRKMRHSYGGGIYFLNSKGEINNTLFESNEACSTAKFTDYAMTCEGGSICFKKSEFNITNNIFLNNLISVPKEFSRPKLSGAAIFANESSILNIYNCDFFK